MSRAGTHRAGRRPGKTRALARQTRTSRTLRHQLALALARVRKAEEDNVSLRKLVVDLCIDSVGNMPLDEIDLTYFLDAEEN